MKRSWLVPQLRAKCQAVRPRVPVGLVKLHAVPRLNGYPAATRSRWCRPAPHRCRAAGGAQSVISRSGAGRRAFRAASSRTNWSRCPGSTHCCCRTCVRRTSSPITIMGTPSDNIVIVRKFFTCRLRSFSISGSSDGTFDAAVPASIVVAPVVVSFAVQLVMLLVIGDQVVERKAIVTGNEVDALFRLHAPCGRRGPGCLESGRQGGPPSRSLPVRRPGHHPETSRSTPSSYRRQSCPPDRARPRPRPPR